MEFNRLDISFLSSFKSIDIQRKLAFTFDSYVRYTVTFLMIGIASVYEHLPLPLHMSSGPACAIRYSLPSTPDRCVMSMRNGGLCASSYLVGYLSSEGHRST